jgi:hypothetical protein
MTVLTRFKDLWSHVKAFIDRPRGGLEVEMVYAGIELCVAVLILINGQEILDTPSFQIFYWKLSYVYVGIAWLVSAVLTYFGLILFWTRHKLCAVFRFLGALFSATVWFWVFWNVSTTYDRMTTAIVTGVSVFGIIWQYRIMISALSRQRRYWIEWHVSTD